MKRAAKILDIYTMQVLGVREDPRGVSEGCAAIRGVMMWSIGSAPGWSSHPKHTIIS
ncbi:MAG: hypothetical protein C5S49_04315 [Candidatus Methanogaster sp.]|nr:MAG: hypothetical protein C5S49_04315 [ANME-2 cluster archaeon]